MCGFCQITEKEEKEECEKTRLGLERVTQDIIINILFILLFVTVICDWLWLTACVNDISYIYLLKK